jgi:hypothetical protein
MNVTPHNETVHKELISKIDDLLDFCRLNGYSHLVLIGKEGQCSRYMEGTFDDIGSMVTSLGMSNESFGEIVEVSNKAIKKHARCIS